MADSTPLTHSILTVSVNDADTALPSIGKPQTGEALEIVHQASMIEATTFLLKDRLDDDGALPVALIVALNSGDAMALDPLLSGFFRQVGPFAAHVAIICEKPDVPLLTSLYEYGVLNIFTTEQWKAESSSWLGRLMRSLKTSTWAFGHGLTRLLRSGDHVGIERELKKVDRTLESDYRVGFVVGKAQEVLGNIPAASLAFKGALDRNPHFMLAKSAYATTLAQMGRKDEALQMQEEMQQKNPGSVERQLSLAALHMERGDFAKAEEFAGAAEKYSQFDPRALEARAHLLINQGKTAELMPILDQIEEGGQLLAARLNDMAIAMAKAGNISGALELYNKTHRIVRKDLKFKVTLNIALTYLKTQQVEKCRQALDLCEQEFGGPFEKLLKMREVLTSAKPAA